MNPIEQTNYSEREDRPSKDNNNRYKYCCRKCKHSEKGKKSCVCVVPLSQRRTGLSDSGCQTCKCKGCSVEDYIKRGEDPVFRPQRVEKTERESYHHGKDYCCKKCLASKSHKRCICQLPKNRRRNKLSSKGCKLCGCNGCNPLEEESRSSSSPSHHKSEESENASQAYHELEKTLNNVDRSLLGRIVAVEYNLNPALLGLGVPQRTPSYILGRPL